MPLRVDRTREIEDALSKTYIELMKAIKRDSSYPDLTLIRQRYQRKVHDATRQAITQVFAQGHHYVSSKLKVETFLSTADLLLIRQETDKATATFWKRIEADSTRQQEIAVQKQKIIVAVEPKSEFDTRFYMENAAMIATTGALALSTLTKSQQVASDPELKEDNPDLKRPRIRWIAQQDERTCLRLPNGNPGCAFLDGQEWDYDDPEIPVPGRLGPNGTHPNCRCYLSLE